jgi:hypothetical protein
MSKLSLTALVGVAALAAPASAATTRVYAVVVGVNTSSDQGVVSLKYADDDAAKYAKLFERMADETSLLAVFDGDSRGSYLELARRARVPERKELERVLSEVGKKVAADHARGDEAALFFVYTGHGARAQNGEGYVNLVDGRLTRTDLHRLLLSRTDTAGWERPDALHIIVDACSAYFLVHDRGSDLTPSDKDYSAHMGDLFGAGASPERYPHVGFVLATTGDVKVHEWSAYRGGVFSHLVRSGLSGAADVDLDGRVTYPELGAFIAAASGAIQDPRARIDVTITAPARDAEIPISERTRFSPRQLVLLDASVSGHFEVESELGERVLDLHKAKGHPTVFAVWGAGRYYLASAEGESVLDFSRKSVIASPSLRFGAPRRAERGAIDEEYRRALFSRPFDSSFFDAYCSLKRLPSGSGKRTSAVHPGEADLLALMGPPALERRSESGSRIRTATWTALGGGLLLGGGSAVFFSVAAGAKSEAAAATERGTADLGAESRAMTFSAAGAGTAVAAGAAVLVGGALLSLDLLNDEWASATVTPTASGLALAGRF